MDGQKLDTASHKLSLSFKLCTTSDTIQLTNCNYYLILKRGVVGYAKQVFKYVN